MTPLLLSLGGGRELEVTRIPTRPGEVFRVTMYARRGSFRTEQGELSLTRADVALLLAALERATPAGDVSPAS